MTDNDSPDTKGVPMFVMPNRYEKRCQCTGNLVPAGTGFAVKRDTTSRWETYCGDLSLLPKWLVEAISEKGPVVRKLHSNGMLEMPYDREAMDLIRSIPGRRWDAARKCNWVSMKKGDLPRVIEICDMINVEVDANLRTVAEMPVMDSIDLMTYQSASGHALFPFQREGVTFLRNRMGMQSLMADDMGLGKTVQTLLALPATASNVRAVVIAPAAVRFNWRDEIKEWRSDLKVTVLKGRNSFRWPYPGEVVITGFSTLPKFEVSRDSNWEPAGTDMISSILLEENTDDVVMVVDEIHRAKNWKSQRSKRITALSRIVGTTWGLTGTPLAGRPTDLYGTLNSLGVSRDVFGGWKGFLNLFNAHKGEWGGWVFGEPDPSVPDRLRKVAIRRRKSEVLPDLPNKLYTTIPVECTGRLRTTLNRMWKTYQIGDTTSLPSFEEFSKVRAALAASRTSAAIELIEDFEEAGEPVVVFSAHKAPVHEIAQRDGWALIDGGVTPKARQDAVRRFQNGELKGLACTIQAAGVGLTMTRASTIIFIDMAWTPADNAQAEDRICRIGQTANKCQIIRLVSDHALDQHVLNLLANKQRLIEGAVENTLTYTKTTNPVPVIDAQTIALAKAEAQKSPAQRSARVAGQVIRNRNLVTRLAPRTNKTVTLSDTLRKEVGDALEALLSVCDGAIMEDGVGFNKPDSYIGRLLAVASMKDDEAVVAGFHLVYKYKGQLGGHNYPTIYG